jgi:hypothetical protein
MASNRAEFVGALLKHSGLSVDIGRFITSANCPSWLPWEPPSSSSGRVVVGMSSSEGCASPHYPGKALRDGRRKVVSIRCRYPEPIPAPAASRGLRRAQVARGALRRRSGSPGRGCGRARLRGPRRLTPGSCRDCPGGAPTIRRSLTRGLAHSRRTGSARSRKSEPCSGWRRGARARATGGRDRG